MPGLVCILNNNNDSGTEKLLGGMISSIKHRDWYQVDTFCNDRIGMARVSLGKFNSEPQPLYNEDNSLMIMMDGEVYDYQELKDDLIKKGHKFSVDNDVEFILHMYEEHGKDFAKKTNASFNAIIWDSKKEKLLVTNDRYGLRPLYYAQYADKIVFAPELKAIIHDKEFKRELNDSAVSDFFTFGYILGEKTFFKGINLLPSASITTIDTNKLICHENYWDFEYGEEITDSEEVIIKKLGELIRQAVKRRLGGNFKIGIPLSGGLDSRTIAASAKEFKDDIHTFTYGKKGCYDRIFSAETSEMLGFKHHEIDSTADDLVNFAENVIYHTEGAILTSFVYQYALNPLLEKNCEVTLNGIVGDMQLENYLRYGDEYDLCGWDNQIQKFLSKISLVSEKKREEIFTEDYYLKIKDKSYNNFIFSLKSYDNLTLNQKGNIFCLKNRQKRYTPNGYLINALVGEVRTPFYDNDYIDYTLKIPEKFKYDSKAYVKHKGLYQKFILNEFPDVARVGWEVTGAPLTANYLKVILAKYLKNVKHLINRAMKKVGVAYRFDDPSKLEDYRNWARDNYKLRKFLRSIILDKRTIQRCYFREDQLKKIVEDHINYKEDYHYLLYLILSFEIWNRIFMDKNN